MSEVHVDQLEAVRDFELYNYYSGVTMRIGISCPYRDCDWYHLMGGWPLTFGDACKLAAKHHAETGHGRAGGEL